MIQHGSFARLLGAVIVACGLWTASMPIAALFGTHQHGHLPLAMTAVGPQLPPVVR